MRFLSNNYYFIVFVESSLDEPVQQLSIKILGVERQQNMTKYKSKHIFSSNKDVIEFLKNHDVEYEITKVPVIALASGVQVSCIGENDFIQRIVGGDVFKVYLHSVIIRDIVDSPKAKVTESLIRCYLSERSSFNEWWDSIGNVLEMDPKDKAKIAWDAGVNWHRNS